MNTCRAPSLYSAHRPPAAINAANHSCWHCNPMSNHVSVSRSAVTYSFLVKGFRQPQLLLPQAMYLLSASFPKLTMVRNKLTTEIQPCKRHLGFEALGLWADLRILTLRDSYSKSWSNMSNDDPMANHTSRKTFSRSDIPHIAIEIA